jgi:hypothetical protein
MATGLDVSFQTAIFGHSDGQRLSEHMSGLLREHPAVTSMPLVEELPRGGEARVCVEQPGGDDLGGTPRLLKLFLTPAIHQLRELIEPSAFGVRILLIIKDGSC